MSRLFDIVALVAVAVVLLVPKPSVVAQPALTGDPLELDRLAALEDARFRHPNDVEPALELADGFLSFMRADWVLATLDEFSQLGDYRVHLLRATARAERLEAQLAVEEAVKAEKACDEARAGRAGTACPEHVYAKIDIIRRSMQVLVDEKIDPAKDPQRARNAVAAVLHSAKYKMPAPKK